jgi:NADH-quinone oxidoreductase B subunit
VNEGEGAAAAHGAGGVVALGIPRVGAPDRGFGTGFDLAPKPLKLVLNWGRKYSLWVFNFGLACCAIEFIAASMARHDFIRLGVIPFAPGPRQADLMVVSGTVSDKMAPAVKRLYEQMPEPKYVISFGACANCGGPYWDSYAVTKGIDQVIPVDVYVPGCPPRPEALLHGIVKLQEKIAAEGTGARRPRIVSGTAIGDGKAPAGRPIAARTATKSRRQRSRPAETETGASAAAARRAIPAPSEAPTAEVLPAAPLEATVFETPAAEAPTAEIPTPGVQGTATADAGHAARIPRPLVPPPGPGSVTAGTAPSFSPDAPTVEVVPLTGSPEAPAARAPKVKAPRRHYFRELRRARDHGLSLFDEAADDQEWEYDDES